ncbi:NAD(P)-dependent oxidoreductase [Salinibacterium sp. ZJ450]|uniref:NAD-dependent epimerase/dehydratase family protein n=1 Tax=Salinibacterium sp. ZJ450 TaxID=2708338 RepID=UPI0014246771|nr:NAD(P)-dependent oxidoreductase [Salinibacterium sp. ZJ450]
MRVLLAGASGTLGAPLIRQLVAAGHDVTGLGRSGSDRMRQLGVTPLIVDVLDRDALLAAVDGHHFDAVINELTSLKKLPLQHRHMAATNTLRSVGTTHLVEVARATGAGRFLTQSIVFGYGFADHGTEVLTEQSPFGVMHGTEFDVHVSAMVDTEQQAMTAEGIEGIALRYGLFYGAPSDTNRVVSMLRKHALPVARHGGELPFIHHEDAAAATVAALERGIGGQAYNIVDDLPATFRDLVTAIADAHHAPHPLPLPTGVLELAAPYGAAVLGEVSMRVSNAKAKAELGWMPRFPTYREGAAG